jgi:lipopolysaccharide biosynthesis glycosyltransferase
MRSLVVFIASGSRYALMAQASIYSLRLFYNGPVILLSDRIVQGDFTTRLVKGFGKNLKFNIHRILPLEEYDKVLYFDCDILFARSISPLFDMIKRDNFLSAVELGSRILHKCRTTRFRFRSKREEELAKKVKGCNSGFFGATARNFAAFCEMWRKVMRRGNLRYKNPGYIYDQPYYNASLMEWRLRERKPKIIEIPSGCYSYNGRKLGKVIFTHFTHNKPRMFPTLRGIQHRYKFEKPKPKPSRMAQILGPKPFL